MSRVADLVAELEAAHDAFHDALAQVDLALVTVPGVVDEWSVRDLVVHIAFWSEHGADAIERATSGSGADFDYSTDDTDAINARVFANAQQTDPRAALDREEAAIDRFRERLAALDHELLGLRLGNGDTVEEVVRYDGPDHYAEHAAHLRDATR